MKLNKATAIVNDKLFMDRAINVAVNKQASSYLIDAFKKVQAKIDKVYPEAHNVVSNAINVHIKQGKSQAEAINQVKKIASEEIDETAQEIREMKKLISNPEYLNSKVQELGEDVFDLLMEYVKEIDPDYTPDEYKELHKLLLNNINVKK